MMQYILPLLKKIATTNQVSLEMVLTSAIMSQMKADLFPSVIKELYVDKLNLLPEVWYPADSWRTLPRPKMKKGYRKKKYITWSDNITDEFWIENYPPRAKVDLSIRRVRMNDVYFTSLSVIGITETRKRFELLAGFDYIITMNIMLCSLYLGEQWWIDWSTRGTFSMDFSDFITDARMISDIIKKTGLAGRDYWKYMEIAPLTGFITDNDSGYGFDKQKATQDLAASGLGYRNSPTNEEWLVYFKRIAKEMLYNKPNKTEFISFYDWVHNASNWETAGSSSTGKIFWSFGAETGKFNVRKNLVPDVISMDELYYQATHDYIQTNTSITKTEPVRTRLAVSSDLITYLRQSWLAYLSNHWYHEWEGSTIEETNAQMYARMVDMIEMTKTQYSLPFDYAGFDHQPSKEETAIILESKYHAARTNTPPEEWANLDHIISLDKAGYATATLTDTEKGIKTVYHVDGGIMSGLRDTTLAGNAWNTLMSRAAKDTVKAAISKDFESKQYIRGDDSAIFLPNYFITLMWRFGYQYVGAIGNTSKFGIHKGATEFLRTWLSEKAHGYPARAIVSITQRKPWSSEPLDLSQVWRTIKESMFTVVRRGGEQKTSDILWTILKKGSALRGNYDYNVFQTPISRGGLGVDQWTEQNVVSKIPTLKGKKVDFVNTTQYRNQVWARIAEQNRLPTSSKDIEQLVSEDRMTKVAGDDIMSFSAAIRPELRSEMRKMKRHHDASEAHIPTIICLSGMISQPQLAGRDWLHDTERFLNASLLRTGFGEFEHKQVQYTEIKRLRPNFTISETIQYMDSLEPQAGNRMYESWVGLKKTLPTMVAKDWLFGQPLSAQPTGLNTMFVGILTKFVTLAVALNKHTKVFRDTGVLLRTVSKAFEDVTSDFISLSQVSLLNGW